MEILKRIAGSFRGSDRHSWKLPRFRRMMRLAEREALPKGLRAPGFDGFVQIGRVPYLTRGTTCFRLLPLLRSGRAWSEQPKAGR
jgi:hypothetical protein